MVEQSVAFSIGLYRCTYGVSTSARMILSNGIKGKVIMNDRLFMIKIIERPFSVVTLER